MSMMSLNIRGSKLKENKDDKLLENTSLGHLARSHFRLATPPQYSHKEPREPLLRATPSEEKETLVRQWRVMMRFTGDLVNYRQGMTNSCQPNLGSVMGRLYKELGVVTEEVHEEEAALQDSMVDGLNLKSLPNKPRGGTLRRLRETLTTRLFKNKTQTIFHTLPMEDTLMTSLDQVHYIIGLAILKPQLRDELYCQVSKQVVKNPYKTSSARLWLLLALIISCFPPSEEIYEAIQGFVEEGPSMYSKPVLKLLKSSRKNGVRHQPPSFLELESYLEKKPIELQVTLMDGTVQTVVADGTSTAHDICTRLCDAVGLHQNFGYSLYISMSNKVASLGSRSDRIMDSVSQCEQLFRDQHHAEGHAPWRLFYRKELFSPWDEAYGDMIAISLAFTQIVRGIMLGEYVVDSDQELAILAAKQYYTEYGDEINADGLHGLLPSYIPADRRKQDDSLKMWRRLVIKAHHKLFVLREDHKRPTIEKVKYDVISYAKTKWAMSFSRYYEVVELEGPQWGEIVVTLAINSSGVYVLSSEKRMLQEISFLDIVTIRGESTSNRDSRQTKDDIILFVLTDGSFIKFESPDAADIRDLVEQMVQGLRLRSKWAVIREDVNESTTESIDLGEGELIELQQPAGKGALSERQCYGTNSRTGETGQIPSNILYVLPVLDRPSEDMMRPFRIHKRRGPFSSYLDDAARMTHKDSDSLNNGEVYSSGRKRTISERSNVSQREHDVIKHNGHMINTNSHVTGNGHVNNLQDHITLAEVTVEANGIEMEKDEVYPGINSRNQTISLDFVDHPHATSSVNGSTDSFMVDESAMRKSTKLKEASPEKVQDRSPVPVIPGQITTDSKANSEDVDNHCLDDFVEMVDRSMTHSPDMTSELTSDSVNSDMNSNAMSDVTFVSPIASPQMTSDVTSDATSDRNSPFSSPHMNSSTNSLQDLAANPSDELAIKLTHVKMTDEYVPQHAGKHMKLSIAQEDMECHL